MRMLQGFSTGGEIGGAASYIREWAAPNRRPFYISFIPSVAQLGKGAAAGIAALAALAMPGPAMESWGWRIPFLLALPLGALCLYCGCRSRTAPSSSPPRPSDNTTDKPVKDLFRHYRAPLAKVIAISTVQNIGTYVGTVFISVYFSNVLGFSKGAASTIVLLAVLLAAVLIPIAGQLGSRIGAKRVLVVSYVAYVAPHPPVVPADEPGHSASPMLGLALGMIPYALCQAGTYADHARVLPGQGPPHRCRVRPQRRRRHRRRRGPYLATWLIGDTGNNFIPASSWCSPAPSAWPCSCWPCATTPPTAHLFR